MFHSQQLALTFRDASQLPVGTIVRRQPVGYGMNFFLKTAGAMWWASPFALTPIQAAGLVAQKANNIAGPPFGFVARVYLPGTRVAEQTKETE